MKVVISYPELAEYIKSNFDKNVAFTYVDETTVTVSASVKIVIMPVSIPITLHVISAKGSDVELTYSGKYGLDSVISGLLTFLESKISRNANFISYGGDQRVTLNLGKIDKLKSVFEKISLDDIKFTTTAVEIAMSLIG